LYGDHPYASPPEGSEETLRALTREAIAEFHARHYVARNAVIAIVGAQSRDAAAALAETLVGKLPAGQAAPVLPAVANLEASRVIRIAHPSSQSHIYVGAPGVARLDPDYFTLYVGNHVLGGGGLVSRLTDEIREKRGLSYSVYSYFMPLGRPGPFQMGLQTRNDQAAQALDLLNATLTTYVKEGPTQTELDAAKDNITGGFPLRIDSNADIVQYLAVIGFYGLPLDYLDTFNDRIRAVTVGAVKEAFQRRVHPASMITVIVGGESEAAAAPK
jgi:zinc protease